MNVLTALPWRKPPPPRPPRALPDNAAAREPGGEGEAGCGWYESSHDLASGLQVCEFARPADLPGESLPLADWLALQLAGWPGAALPS